MDDFTKLTSDLRARVITDPARGPLTLELESCEEGGLGGYCRSSSFISGREALTALAGVLQEALATPAPAADSVPNVAKALELAVMYGGIDGSHHKNWVIDQMVRALTGCPEVSRTMEAPDGSSYTYQTQGESEAYRKLVAEACSGVDGPNTYHWDVGIAP